MMKSCGEETRRTRGLLKTLGTVLLALSLPAWAQNPEAPGNPPNIVVVLADDQGYADVGRFGARGFTTPNIDRMAAEGVVFTNFYVSQAVCSASRASLLTGCYSERVGIRGALMPSSTVGLSSDEETIAGMLKAKGYATGIFGKWHLGHYREFLPLQHGFDEYFGLPYSNDMWPVDYDGRPMEKGKSSYPPLPLIEANDKISEIRTLADQSDLTTLYTQRAVRFIERNRDRPFFLYVPHSMPHVPLGVSTKFRGKSRQGMYGDVIMEIDWSVGEILRAIARAGLDRNTIVIYTSDNGPWLNFGNHAGSARPLREGKGTAWEGGPRVPCIMRWPGVIPQGTECRKIASTIDLLPTLAAICGATLPAKPIDGVNILPLLKGEKDANPRDHFLYFYDGELQAVRMGKWKLHFPHTFRSYAGVEPGRDGHPGPYSSGKTGLELYDLDIDAGETANIAVGHPDIVETMQRLGATAREDLGDVLTGTQGRGVRPPGRAGSERAVEVRTLALGKKISLARAYSRAYRGSGDNTLIDGKRGSLDQSDGAWQGYEGVNLEARIDLGAATPVRRVTAEFLENQAAWIFLPAEVEIAVSRDGASYDVVKRIHTERDTLDLAAHVREFPVDFAAATPVRFVRVIARNIGVCPSWHPGAGGKAWLFSDEIVLE